MSNPPQEPEALATLRQMIHGNWVSKAISVAADLGIADVLRAGPRSSEEIARETQATEDGVYRLLRALSVVGVFAELDGRRFALTSISEYLRSDRPDSVRGLARLPGHDAFWRAWGELGYGVRTGHPVFEHVFGMPIFEHLARDAEAAAVFNDAMTSISAHEADAVAAAYDFSGISRLADVAGGHGMLLATLLQKNPELRGVLFEMPHALEGARRLFQERDVAARCEVVSGDFFKTVPPDCDAYLMKHIIHDWDDARSIAILATCRKAMKPKSRLLVVDIVIPPPGEPHFGKLLDLEMMAMTQHGKERTRDEFEALYRRANLRLSRIVPTNAPVSVVEGIPA
jgi:C-methyltransferase